LQPRQVFGSVVIGILSSLLDSEHINCYVFEI